ncbi:MAG: nuclear transport factor 2 family protein [Parafilimonas terrae]|nr:nuclear transport factor 2 family protein [Parafilimonas terrae]
MLSTDDIVAIYQLESFCHHAIDHTDLSLLPQVFTADMRFDGRGCEGPLLEGLEAVTAFFALGKPPHPPAHQASSYYAYEKDGQIRCKSKWFILDPGGSGIYVGDNDDEVVRTADGWRIRERIATKRSGWITPEMAKAAMASSV